MTNKSQPMAVVTGTGHYLPDKRVSSSEVEARVDANSPGFRIPHGQIQRLSGVKYRHYSDGLVSSDMAARAGLEALRSAEAEVNDVDVLIYAAASHDIAEPATANIVQLKMGCSDAHVFDVKNACNSFLNGLEIANLLIRARRARRVLVAAGEVISPFIDWHISSREDFRLKFAALTLGDGGGACLVEPSLEPDRGILSGRFFSDGAQWELSTIMAGGSLMKADFSRMYFECDIEGMQSLAVHHIPRLVKGAMEDVGWHMENDLKLAIPHQVSERLIRRICEAIALPMERCVITLKENGNTAGASIPIALSTAVDDGRIRRGDKIILVGGGSGFSGAVIPVIW